MPSVMALPSPTISIHQLCSRSNNNKSIHILFFICDRQYTTIFANVILWSTSTITKNRYTLTHFAVYLSSGGVRKTHSIFSVAKRKMKTKQINKSYLVIQPDASRSRSNIKYATKNRSIQKQPGNVLVQYVFRINIVYLYSFASYTQHTQTHHDHTLYWYVLLEKLSALLNHITSKSTRAIFFYYFSLKKFLVLLQLLLRPSAFRAAQCEFSPK